MSTTTTTTKTTTKTTTSTPATGWVCGTMEAWTTPDAAILDLPHPRADIALHTVAIPTDQGAGRTNVLSFRGERLAEVRHLASGESAWRFLDSAEWNAAKGPRAAVKVACAAIRTRTAEDLAAAAAPAPERKAPAGKAPRARKTTKTA